MKHTILSGLLLFFSITSLANAENDDMVFSTRLAVETSCDVITAFYVDILDFERTGDHIVFSWQELSNPPHFMAVARVLTTKEGDQFVKVTDCGTQLH